MTPETLEAQADAGLQLATFEVEETTFGIDTACVQEVVRMGEITPVYHAPKYVMGLRNLRGRIVTVVDLRVRLELGSAIIGPESRILIVEWHGEPVGLLVDRVADTIEVNPKSIEPPPANLGGIQGRNLRGICRDGNGLVALLDVEVILAPEVGQAIAREPRGA
jgi:purine-binding chemotaxis protein CheW